MNDTDELAAKLKEAAGDATTAEWESVRPDGAEDDAWGVAVKGEGGLGIAQMVWANDSEYIALANPANLTRLLEEREQLKAELTAMTADRNLWQDEHNGDCPNIAELTRLRASNAELLATAIWVRDKHHRTLAPYCHAHEWDALLRAIKNAEASQ
jgi:hypothetical protein